MASLISNFTADHKFLLGEAARAAQLDDPVAFDAGGHQFYLLREAIRGPLVPLDGALIRQWMTGVRHFSPSMHFGTRLYTLEGIRFVHVNAVVDGAQVAGNFNFFVAARKDYLRLFRHSLRAMREREVAGKPPIMSAEQFDTLSRNTLGYLDPKNLKRIKELGGRAKRGLLLTGPPGNGKTSACRWLWQECLRHGLEYTMVTPDAYRAARNSCNPVATVRQLFTVARRGVIFFDDMDIALRDRNTVKETDDQAVFLSALDGIEVNEGVVYVFTTNCGLDLIDPAFKRPGRIDLVLRFQKPEASLRRELVERWHADVRGNIDLASAVNDTNGLSFAEIEELKNLLILRHLEVGEWEWEWAMQQFHQNRSELETETHRRVGFGILETSANGD